MRRDTVFTYGANDNDKSRDTDGQIGHNSNLGSGFKHMTFTYDGFDRQTSQSVNEDYATPDPRTTTTTRWPSGQIKERTKPNGVVDGWGFSADGLPRVATRRSSTGTPPLAPTPAPSPSPTSTPQCFGQPPNQVLHFHADPDSYRDTTGGQRLRLECEEPALHLFANARRKDEGGVYVFNSRDLAR